VQVVGRQQRQLEVLGQPHEVLAGAPLDAVAVVHELGEVVLGAEDVAQLRRGLPGQVVLPQPQACLDLTADAAGGRDQPLAVAVESSSRSMRGLK
jgi:hypothetical protein